MDTNQHQILEHQIPCKLLKDRILVWHLLDEYFDAYAVDAAAYVLPEWYTLVAAVKTTCLDEAFWLTNHDGKLWYRKPKVNYFSKTARSTSRNDVLVKPDGKSYFALSRGWRRTWHNRIWMHL